jgi:hypothetical protein
MLSLRSGTDRTPVAGSHLNRKMLNHTRSLAYQSTHTMVDRPSGPFSSLGGSRKSVKQKICGDKSRSMISDRVDIGLNRPMYRSCWV